VADLGAVMEQIAQHTKVLDKSEVCMLKTQFKQHPKRNIIPVVEISETLKAGPAEYKVNLYARVTR
jgi:hypothetical protein